MKVTVELIQKHLQQCSVNFTPSLDEYVDIVEYAKKIHEKSTMFTWLNNNGCLVGLVAAYDILESKICWITNVSVIPECYRQGIATRLLEQCEMHFRSKNYSSVYLEVFKENEWAIELYKRNNYIEESSTVDKFVLKKDIS